MTFDLRTEPWIPFQRRSGRVVWSTLSALTEAIDSDDPIIAIGSGRSDFDGALAEFLIGMLTVALAPADDEDWARRYHAPPTPVELQAAFDALPGAFQLIGDGPRFLQDATASDFAHESVGDVEQLLIEAAGDQTIRNNADLFVKRDRFPALGPAAAAIALLTLQSYAPAGGRGHRTSLRGGGPLTTLADPRRPDHARGIASHQQPLWQLVWANVRTTRELEKLPGAALREPALTFPWLSVTRTSEKDRATTPGDGNPCQMYFAMPRRVRLEVGAAGQCAMTGSYVPFTIIGYRARPFGVKYEGWFHALSPYYESKDQWLPVHGQPGGIGWRDWYAYTLQSPVSTTKPAATVLAFENRRAALLGLDSLEVRAFGYDMDNMKARSWVNGTMPAFAVRDEQRQRVMTSLAVQCTSLVDLLSSLLSGCIKRAQFASPDDVKGDLSQGRAALWAETESAFYEVLRATASRLQLDEAMITATLRDFYNNAATIARSVFTLTCPTEGVKTDRLKRTIDQRFALEMMLRGRGKMGAKLFASIGVLAAKPSRPPKTRAKRAAT